MPEIDWRNASRNDRQILYRHLKAEMDRRGLTLHQLIEAATGSVMVGHGYDANMRSGRFSRKYAYQFYDWLERENPARAASVTKEVLAAGSVVILDRGDSPAIEKSTGEEILRKQTYLLVRQIRADIHQEILDQRRILSDSIVAFLTAYDLVNDPDEFYPAPWDALIHIAGFICAFGQEAARGGEDLIPLICGAEIRSGVKYDALLKLQNITIAGIRIWEAAQPIRDHIAGDKELESDQAGWEASLKIYWLWKQYPIYDALHQKLEDGITSGAIEAGELQRGIVSALKSPPHGYRDLRQIAWQPATPENPAENT